MESTLHGAMARDLDLRTLAFDYLAEPTLLLDPDTDEIIDANPAACTLLGYDRALLRETKFSALHAGQVPALIVFSRRAQKSQVKLLSSRKPMCRP